MNEKFGSKYTPYTTATAKTAKPFLRWLFLSYPSEWRHKTNFRKRKRQQLQQSFPKIDNTEKLFCCGQSSCRVRHKHLSVTYILLSKFSQPWLSSFFLLLFVDAKVVQKYQWLNVSPLSSSFTHSLTHSSVPLEWMVAVNGLKLYEEVEKGQIRAKWKDRKRNVLRSKT